MTPSTLLSAPGASVPSSNAPREADAGPWRRAREEAAALIVAEPLLRRALRRVLDAASPEQALASLLAHQLGSGDFDEADLRGLLLEVLMSDGRLVTAAARDVVAVTTRDPACPGPLHVLLNLKGFHALQAHRVAHHLWKQGRRDLARALAGAVAMRLAVDIHPAASIGSGVMLDHASGIVIGETAVVEDEVSILQGVTLGGTGKEHGDRHPKVRRGVMIGAGAKVLGNIEVGAMSKVAAGSVVLETVPPHCTVAGVPARVVRRHREGPMPAQEMDQRL